MTTALQQLKDKLKEIAAEHPYDTYSDYNQGWSKALDLLEPEIDGLVMVEQHQIEKAHHDGWVSGKDTVFISDEDYFTKTYKKRLRWERLKSKL